jgi:hypothetical protein
MSAFALPIFLEPLQRLAFTIFQIENSNYSEYTLCLFKCHYRKVKLTF